MKMENKKTWIAIAAIMILLWLSGLVATIQDGEKDNNIGQTIVIKQDTLMVLSFNNRTDNYILDDGREVNEEIIRLFKIETNVEERRN